MTTKLTFTFGTFPFVEGREYDVDAETGCWVWKRKLTAQGYGRVDYNRLRIMAGTQFAHRAGWTLLNSTKLPRTTDLHHRCRNILCINPGHLEPLEHRDHLILHFHGASHLSYDDIRAMREAHWAGESLEDLAVRYAVHGVQVGRICAGKQWIEAGGPIGHPPKVCETCGDTYENGHAQARYCSKRCKTRANYLRGTPHRRRQPAVLARWGKAA